MSKFATKYFISWVVVYSTGKTRYYNDNITISYDYLDEIVPKVEDYIRNTCVYTDALVEDGTLPEITLLSICKLI